jgi:glycosyltransferase involved in cell wall biosynthesis
MLFALGKPVVIGPLNGGMEYPPAFHHTESWISRVAIALARFFANAANTLLPGKKHASVVLVANQRTRRALPSGIRGRIIELVENGVDIGDWQAVPQPKESVLPRFVFIGRLVDWKAVDVVIRALEKVPVAELEIIGDGPMRHAWTRLAGDLSLQNRIQFTGWLPQQECAAHLHSATALVLPSLFECGGAVVLEAMAMGKPVIATRWGGPADYLDASSGMLVDPESYSALVTGFATAMQKLIDSPALANSMGSAGRQRVLRDFDWQQKIDQVISIYRSLAEKTGVSQEFEDRRVSPAAVSQHH